MQQGGEGTYSRVCREAGVVLKTNCQRTHDGSQAPGNGEVEDTADSVSWNHGRGCGREGSDEVTRIHLQLSVC